jgi:glycosyltransferase involved in cell wall biosynthesis
MSNAIMEAMQHGLPIIGSNVAGTVELLAGGNVGLIFAPGDIESLAGHIRTLAADEGLRHGLGLQAERRIQERFTDGRMVAATLDFYATLARRKALEREAAAFERGREVLGTDSGLLQTAVDPLS